MLWPSVREPFHRLDEFIMSAVVKPPSLHYRSVAVVDIPDIMAIEERVYKFPWTRRIFLDCVRVGYTCECCEADGRLVAYGIMSMKPMC